MDQQVEGNLWRYMNHSDSPNVFIDSFLDEASGVEVVKVFISKSISAGEELCFNYGKQYWNDSEK